MTFRIGKVTVRNGTPVSDEGVHAMLASKGTGLPRVDRTILTALVALAALAFAATPAFAFYEGGTTDSTADCNGCHGNDLTASAGPHGGYMTTSNKCYTCHSVHVAPTNSERLLSGPTVKSTCEACHDGTGGKGVYGVLAARGLSPVSRHRIDVTGTIPGGDASTGGTSTAVFTGEGGALSCDDCHSPHASSLVASFTGDRMRTTTDTAGFLSTRLLRRKPTSSNTTVTVYGSNWCGGCHKGRVSETSTRHNHPADTTATAGYFYYERVARVTSNTGTTTELGTLGRTNRGYVMPYPRSSDQTGHAPICQQCHEDPRTVGAPGSVTTFTVTAPDGTAVSDNPRFQTFPHETQSSSLLIETGESLCLNCHEPGRQMF